MVHIIVILGLFIDCDYDSCWLLWPLILSQNKKIMTIVNLEFSDELSIANYLANID